MIPALPARPRVPPAASGGLLLELLDQARHALGGLRTVSDPIVHPLKVELQGLFLASRDRVEEPEPLDIAPVAPVAAVGHHHVVERPLLSAAPGQTNRHHESRFPRSCRTQCREIPRTAEPPSCRRPQVNPLFYLKSAQWEEPRPAPSTEAGRQAAFHGPHHLGHPALAELLHHFLHLGMLLEDPVDLLDLDSCPPGDPALAGAVDYGRMA